MKKDERAAYENAFSKIGNQVFEALGPTSDIWDVERKLLARFQKTPSFTVAKAVQGLAMGAAVKLAHEDLGAIKQAALLLREFPFTGNYTLWHGPNQVMYVAVMVALREGDEETADALVPYLFKAENGGEPGPPVMTAALDRVRSGQVLQFPRRGVPDDHHFEISQTLGNVLLEICQLATMWCLNSGVTEWSRAEIDEEIERNIAFIPVLDALKGDERPPYLGPDAKDGRL